MKIKSNICSAIKIQKHFNIHQLGKRSFPNQDEEFHVKIAKNTEEVAKLIEVGFDYVCTTL